MKVLFFGNVGVSRRCLEEIILTRNVNITGVCCSKELSAWRSNEYSVYEYCKQNNLPIFEMEELHDINFDVGFSVRYNRLIPKRLIDNSKFGIFNIHGGILPEYRGPYSDIHSIINGEKEYGVTLHFIDEGADTGDIVDILKIPIEPNDTGMSLHRKSEQLCFDILQRNIDTILAGQAKGTPQTSYIKSGHICREYKKIDCRNIKNIGFMDLNSDKALRIIRAFDDPTHEPAYTIINGNRVFLRLSIASTAVTGTF